MIIFVRVSWLVRFVPVVHPVIVVSTDAIIHDEVVLGKATLDDALVLFLGDFIIEVRTSLLNPRPATTLACTLKFREFVEFGLFSRLA